MNKKNILLALFLVLNGCAVNQVDAQVPKQSEVIHVVSSDENGSHEVKTLDEKIGSMFMVGFMGTSAPRESQICQDIQDYNLAGVILFDMNPVNHREAKNIANRAQLAQLTKELQACSKDGKLLISVDQEGGKVQRLKRKYGFYGRFLPASQIASLSDDDVLEHYHKMGAELNAVGINYNLAPDVDLSINKRNHVIYQLGRSFGEDPLDVVKYSFLFMQAMHQNGVLTSIKHFPGHGSSVGDTHKGFVDVSDLWKEEELEPYRLLAQTPTIDTVMVAHVFNENIDATYPATLSEKTVNGLLRETLGFNGVTITDDLQMGAINQKYGLEKTLKLAIGAGNDILLFGNQLSVNSMVQTKTLVETVKDLIQRGEVNLSDIETSNQRLERLKQKL